MDRTWDSKGFQKEIQHAMKTQRKRHQSCGATCAEDKSKGEHNIPREACSKESKMHVRACVSVCGCDAGVRVRY